MNTRYHHLKLQQIKVIYYLYRKLEINNKNLAHLFYLQVKSSKNQVILLLLRKTERD